MTDDERRLLEMAKPDVVLQAAPVFPMDGFKAEPDANPHFDAASSLVAKGWLEFIGDSSPNRSTYRITPDGAAAALQAKE